MRNLSKYWAARNLLKGVQAPLKETLKGAGKKVMILWVVKEVIVAVLLIIVLI